MMPRRTGRVGGELDEGERKVGEVFGRVNINAKRIVAALSALQSANRDAQCTS